MNPTQHWNPAQGEPNAQYNFGYLHHNAHQQYRGYGQDDRISMPWVYIGLAFAAGAFVMQMMQQPGRRRAARGK
jgi:hypothetical protein